MRLAIMGAVMLMMFGCKKPDFEAMSDVGTFEDFFKTRKIYSLKVDLRSASAFEAGHLAQAVHIPAGADFANRLMAVLDEKKAPKAVLLFLYGGADELAALSEIEQLAGQKAFRRRINKVYYLNQAY